MRWASDQTLDISITKKISFTSANIDSSFGLADYEKIKRFNLFIEAGSEKMVKDKTVSFCLKNLRLNYMCQLKTQLVCFSWFLFYSL